MRKICLALALLLVAVPATAGKAVTFNGSYDWSDGGSDELSAEFKPTGDDEWKVTFRFRWNGNSKTWKGRATGSLEDGGTLEGTSGWNGRSWEFTARIEDGVMKGSHTETKSGGERYSTGTFELRR